MMKTWQIVGSTVALGLVVGIGIGYYQTRSDNGDDLLAGGSGTAERRAAEPAAIPATGARPRVEVDEPIHEFGVMDSRAEGSHEFTIRNTGDAPLELRVLSTTCACTIGELKEKTVPPGSSTTARLDWHADSEFGPYEETAMLETNDPETPRVVLTVKGEFRAALQPEPPEITFSRIAAGEPASATVHLYRFLPEEVEIVDVGFHNPPTADRFQVDIEPMPAEQVAEKDDAFGGYLVHVTVKPGLPLGAFQQRIRLHTSLEGKRELVIPVRGMVASDISVFGRDWNAELSVLRMGMVNAAQGGRRTLNLVVSGPLHDAVTFGVKEVDPGFLTVSFGEPRRLGDRATQIPVTIEVPKGAAPLSRLGTEVAPLGQVLLETNHPDAKEVVIRVQFAVEG